jgi:glycosyltransferase involved in cell wall biosynthesis
MARIAAGPKARPGKRAAQGPEKGPGDATRPLRLAVYTLENVEWACAQLRVVQPLGMLRGRVEPVWGSVRDGGRYLVIEAAMERADAVLFQRTFAAGGGRVVFERALASGKPVYLDLDDDFFDIPDTPYFRKRLSFDPGEIAEAVRRAQAVSVATEPLAERVRALGARRVRVLPNLVQPSVWRRAPAGGAARSAAGAGGGPVRVGYLGSPTHEPDLRRIEGVLLDLARRHGRAVEFRFFGCVTPALRGLPGGRPAPFDDRYLSFVRTLPSLGLDVAVAPLVDNAFNRCKSGVKWMEYAMAGVAGVFADLEPYRAVVRHGETGFLAAADADWAEALDALVRDAALRVRVAEAARAAVLRDHDMGTGVAAYEAFWRFGGEPERE